MSYLSQLGLPLGNKPCSLCEINSLVVEVSRLSAASVTASLKTHLCRVSSRQTVVHTFVADLERTKYV